MRPNVTALDQRLAAPMFWVTVVFLAFAAGALHLQNDVIDEVPDVTGAGPAADKSALPSPTDPATHVSSDPVSAVAQEARVLSLTARCVCLWGLLLLLPLFWIEAVFHWRAEAGLQRQHLLSCLLPPLRLGVRDHQSGQSIWLPGIGWATANDMLLQRVERGANWPMILVALLVLPLLAFEYLFMQQIQTSPWLGFLVQIGAGVIWLAFAFEFVVMVSIAENKWRYAREHWIELLIILIPMVGFLRVLRLGRLLRVQQVLRSLRMFRLRGTLLRVWRAVILLQIANRSLRPRPEKRLKQLRELASRQELELTNLRREIAEIEDELQETTLEELPA
jgi:hypothetical protein